MYAKILELLRKSNHMDIEYSEGDFEIWEDFDETKKIQEVLH